MKTAWCSLAAAFVVAVSPAEEIPQPLAEYLGRTIATTMHWKGAGWLIRATREREENAAKMLEELRLVEGMRVCDLGCGNGYHVLPMARKVGKSGQVIGADIQKEMLQMLEARAKGEGLENIQTVLSLPHDPKLPESSVDLVLMVDVYHEVNYPVQLLAGIKKALRPGGRVVLVEYRAEDPTVPIKPLHKMSKEQIHKEMVANGFKLSRAYEGLPWQHLLFYAPSK